MGTYKRKNGKKKQLLKKLMTKKKKFKKRSKKYAAGYSGKILFLSKNFQNFETSSSPALGYYWLYRKWPANWSNCTF